MPCCPLHPALHCTPVCTLSHIPPHASHVSHAHETSPLALPLADPLVVQLRAGCALYPNRTSRGFLDIGWDGRDLVAFEVDKQRWEARQPSQLAELVSKSLNRQKSVTVLLEYLLSIKICQSNVLSVKQYGRAALERQELPVATVFTRTPSLDQLLLVCHVTGFYPRPISVAWLRDGQEVPPGPVLNTSAVLPNADLTYQLRSVLAVTPRDGHSYVCRVRHQSLGTRTLLIPWENRSRAPTASITIAVLLLVAIASAGGFWWWKRRKGNEATWETQEFII
ncbi:T-cell surface glycoprotein CD1b-3-like isoform 4-T4 [Cyanocitta cristata]